MPVGLQFKIAVFVIDCFGFCFRRRLCGHGLRFNLRNVFDYGYKATSVRKLLHLHGFDPLRSESGLSRKCEQQNGQNDR